MENTQWLKLYLPDDLAADMRDKLEDIDRNRFITTSLRMMLNYASPFGKTDHGNTSVVWFIHCRQTYSAAKGAVRIFTKTTPLQCAKENIRVNSIHPGYATTPLTAERFSPPEVNKTLLDRTPMGRLGTAEDIVNGVLFLASDESSWMTGAELVIDGGMTAQ